MKKLSSVFLTITTTVALTGVVGLVPVAQAVTTADIAAQIAALQAQLAQLQGGSSMMSGSFDRNLTVGSRGDDVKHLQEVLISQGFLAASLNTGYFGGLTRAAVAKWQASAGISPAVGYVGPKSRAALNSMAGPAPTPTPGPGPTPGPVVIPGSGLSVTVASDNPASGSMISSTSSAAARVGVLKVNLTASPLAAVTVTDLMFKKLGVLSDSSISSAYLVENGQVIVQYSYINKGVVAFSGMNLTVNAGQTRSLLLAIDPATGLSAGNTVGFGLEASGVLVAGGVPVSGNFPINGNTFTVTSVSNPSIASLTIASASVGTSVYAGTQNVLVSQWTLTGTNSPVNLTSINFKVIGSANKTDIKNVKLYINGSQVGPTLPSVASDGTAYFNLSGAPARINTGSSNMQVYADIMGSPSYTIQFELLNTYDVLAVDTQYNTGVSVTINGGAGVSITINQGQITLTVSSDTPTGNIAKGGSGTVLGKYTIYAAGEAVKVKFLDFSLTLTGTTNTLPNLFKNVALIDDTGLQVGTTINTPPTSNTCTGLGAAAGYNAAGTVYRDCFGTSSSPVNYIVPANTTRTLSLIADVQTTAAFSTVTAALTSESGQNNLQGLTSSQQSSTGAATAAALTLASTPLSVAQSSSLGAPTYAKGANNIRIGSYSLTASSAEAVNVNNITITFNASSTNFQNALLKVGNTQFGTTKSTLSGSDVVTFSGAAINVPRGGAITVDVYADALNSASTGSSGTLTTLTSCTGTGASTNASVSCSPTSVSGQTFTISSGPTVTVSLDQQTAPAQQVVMGSSGNSLMTIRMTNDNVEDVKVTDLTLTQSVGATASIKSSFTNVCLFNAASGAQIGGCQNLVDGASVTTASYKAVFSFGTPIIVPQNQTITLVFKGDAATFTSGGATDNSTSSFKLNATSTVTALGKNSNSSATIAFSSGSNAPTGNTMTVLRSKLTLAMATLGSASNRARQGIDDVGTITFNADPGFDVTVNTVTLKFQGTAVSNGIGAFTVNLIDPNTGSDWSGLASNLSCTPGAGNSCSVTFAFASGTAAIPTITGGGSKSVRVRVVSSNFFNGSNTSDAMTVSVNANTDVNWGDGTATSGLSLQAKDVPTNTNFTVSYE